MLENLDGDSVDKLPHDDEYRRRTSKLPPGLLDEIKSFIDGYCHGHREVKVGWLLSAAGCEQMYRQVVTSLDGDGEEASKFLGQVLWEVLRHRAETWRFLRPEGGGAHPAGMHYWRQGEDQRQ